MWAIVLSSLYNAFVYTGGLYPLGDLGLLFTVFRAYFDAFARPLCRVHPAAACFDEVLAHVMLPYPWCQHESVPRRRRCQWQLQRVNLLLLGAESRGRTIDLVDQEPPGADRK